MSEQRVFKNNGKRFEEDIKASFSNEIWAYRPPDTGGGMMARFTQESICDLIAYNVKTKNLILLELKSTLGTSVGVRPYKEYLEYKEMKEDLEDWLAKLTKQDRKEMKEEIKERKSEVKELYKKLNGAMIKYHQIRELLDAKNDYDIDTFLVITFFKTTGTYAIPIQEFVEFWKNSDKCSINEKDLGDLIEEGRAYSVKQEYIRKTMKSRYDIDFLTDSKEFTRLQSCEVHQRGVDT